MSSNTLILSLIIFWFSCNPKNAPGGQTRSPASTSDTVSIEVQKIVSTQKELCGNLDTIKCKQLGIKYSKLDSLNWSLIDTIKTVGTNRIKTIIRYGKSTCKNKYRESDFRVDSFVFQLKNKSLKISGNYYEEYLGNYIRPHVEFDDYNFDGYIDFRVPNYYISGSMGAGHDYYFYYNRSQTFSFSEEFSRMINLKIDKKRREFTTFSRGGGGIFRAAKYKVVNGNPIPIETVEQDELHDDTTNRKMLFLRKTTYPLRTVDTVKYDTIFYEYH